ncbi:hypothetical protein KCU64_g9, partial [Aureobasidium melanogenum]
MNCSKQQPCSLQRVPLIQGSRGWANGTVHASMSVMRKYAETMSMCSRLWAGTRNMRCTSWNQLVLDAWPVSVSFVISISHQRYRLLSSMMLDLVRHLQPWRGYNPCVRIKVEACASITIVVRSHVSKAEIRVKLHIPYRLKRVALLCFGESVWDVGDLAGEVAIGVNHSGHGACWLAESIEIQGWLYQCVKLVGNPMPHLASEDGMGFLSGIPCRISIRIAIQSSHWTKGCNVRWMNTIDESSRVQNLQSKLLEDRVSPSNRRPMPVLSSLNLTVYLSRISDQNSKPRGRSGSCMGMSPSGGSGCDILSAADNGMLTILNESDRKRQRVDKGSEDLLTRLEAISFSNTYKETSRPRVALFKPMIVRFRDWHGT